MKKKELQICKNKTLTENEKSLKENYERLTKLGFDLAAGKIKNIQEIKTTKKTIAQLLTIINESSGALLNAGTGANYKRLEKE